MLINKIMIVDDDDNIRFIAITSLEGLTEWTVLPASSGKEALAVCLSERPEVVLLDMMMPEMDGVTTLKHLLEQCDPPPVVIFMTAKVQAHELEQYSQLGIKGIISKPFDPMTLPSQVMSILTE
ncbi:MAG: response regulator [Candidatus Obscuribacterales bacterium]|nr:response regulator [Candidatus Obscuribacterales bacterium]